MLRQLVLLTLGVAAYAATPAQVIVPSVTAPAASNATLDILLTGGEGQFTAIQFDLESDTTLKTTAAIGAAPADAGKSLTSADLGSGKKRFLIAGLNQTAITDGVLLTLTLAVPPGTPGRQFPLHLSGAGGANKDGKSALLATTDGVLTVGTNLPKIDGVVNGASFLPMIVDGSWATILGSNLARTTRIWQEADIVGVDLPKVLDDVSVTFNGQLAAVYFVSPTQLNVQVPATGKTGPIAVSVTTTTGTSNTFMVNVGRNGPGLFVFSPTGGRYPAALVLHANGGADYLGPSGLFGNSLATRPARLGEVLELFATGLGPTVPAVPAGRTFSGAAPLVDSVVVEIGGVRASVLFAGLIGPGLYQINSIVPAVSAGEQLLAVKVNDTVAQAGLYVVVMP